MTAVFFFLIPHSEILTALVYPNSAESKHLCVLPSLASPNVSTWHITYTWNKDRTEKLTSVSWDSQWFPPHPCFISYWVKVLSLFGIPCSPLCRPLFPCLLLPEAVSALSSISPLRFRLSTMESFCRMSSNLACFLFRHIYVEGIGKDTKGVGICPS